MVEAAWGRRKEAAAVCRDDGRALSIWSSSKSGALFCPVWIEHKHVGGREHVEDDERTASSSQRGRRCSRQRRVAVRPLKRAKSRGLPSSAAAAAVGPRPPRTCSSLVPRYAYTLTAWIRGRPAGSDRRAAVEARSFLHLCSSGGVVVICWLVLYLLEAVL